MFVGARFLVSAIAVSLSLAVVAQAAGVAIDRDGSVIADQGVGEMTKESFLTYLDTKQSMLISFYQKDSEESDKALGDFDTFAKKVVTRYPDLQLGKVDFKQSPYLTARMLLTGAYNMEIEFGAEEMVHYMDNQLWLDEAPLGGQAQMYCSPFNFCGKALAFIADKSSAMESALPIPKWLAMLLVPAIITFAGRFIIDGMYGAEEQIRNLLGYPRAAEANDEALSDIESEAEQDTDAGASSNRDTSQSKQSNKKKMQ
ncbi:hypothetical protein GGI19_005969 [Coemansia pectinata]|uniref:Uncharacterized protein n=1 Tax=Coemansia pectinata TaxID=1052879 RepID=A0A9W8L702_9FUNG|nr:hypothetical protein GGI19_005969 [Coemansia pectinata]